MTKLGLETQKAVENFPLSEERLDRYFIKAYAMVKLACSRTNAALGYLPQDISQTINEVCQQIIDGKHLEGIVVDPYQGGAGTSTNMNFNELIAGLATDKLAKPVDPLAHVNLHQSTNDTFPTALKVAVLLYLKDLEKNVGILQEACQEKELAFAGVLKLGRTELMDAVPMTLGMEFGAYAEAFARDRWRVFKCRERIKTVNLGGTAIGTGLGAPRDYILKVNEELKRLTGLPVSRSENLIDSTQNLDQLVEVSGILKAMAVNLLKISNDIRLLAMGPDGGLAELNLPVKQKGSTIMPGKVNPVIPEAIGQVALQVISNDGLLSLAAGMGNLELNQYYPLAAHTLLKSLKLLTQAAVVFAQKCITGISPNEENCRKHLMQSRSLATYLLPVLGYDKVEKVLQISDENNKTLKDVILEQGLLSSEQFDELLSPARMSKLGFTPDDYLKQ
jgi:aspartate ammonia-lyase